MGSNSTAIPTTSVAELKYLSLLARDYPTQAAAASAVISLEATAKLPRAPSIISVTYTAKTRLLSTC